jgi:hypothetical protein
MKIQTIILIILSIVGGNYVSAQTSNNTTSAKGGWYTSSGGEIIFSWANATQNGKDAEVITRFSPVFNIQIQAHKDFAPKLGFFTGFNIRNVGYIWDDPDSVNYRYKARSYTVGIPVALKLGNVKENYLFGGYEIEFPFNFKQKVFINEDKKDKVTSWFSPRTPTIYQSWFAGIRFKYGTELKFKYYMTNFFNKDYTANDNGVSVKPYANINANVFYVSLSIQLMKGTHVNISNK